MESSKIMEINLLNIFYRILRHWRTIIIFMIIGAILLDFFGYRRSKQNAAETQQIIDSFNSKVSSGEYDSDGNEVIKLADFEKKLSKKQIYEVKNLLECYRIYQMSRSDIIEYSNNSLLMQLDSNAIPTYSLQYLIDTHYVVEYPEINKKDYTQDIQNSISNKLLSQDYLEEVATAISTDDFEVKSSYIAELIKITPTADTVYITIYGRSEEECKTIYSITKKKLDTVFNELKKDYGDFDSKLLSEQYFESYSDLVIDAKKTKGDSYSSFYGNVYSRIASLNDDQKAYFYALINNDDSITIIPNPKDPTTESNHIDTATLILPEVHLIYPKYIALGMILGLLLVCGWIVLYTVLCGRLVTCDDISIMCKLSQLGIWRITETPKGIFGFIDRWLIHILDGKGAQFTPEESLEMIAAGIRISARKNNWKNIYLTSTANDELTQDSLAKLSEKLKGMVDSVNYGKSIVYDPESLENLSNADAAVILEKIDTSKVREIQTEYNLCNKYNIPIIGYVTLK